MEELFICEGRNNLPTSYPSSCFTALRIFLIIQSVTLHLFLLLLHLLPPLFLHLLASLCVILYLCSVTFSYSTITFFTSYLLLLILLLIRCSDLSHSWENIPRWKILFKISMRRLCWRSCQTGFNYSFGFSTRWYSCLHDWTRRYWGDLPGDV